MSTHRRGIGAGRRPTATRRARCTTLAALLVVVTSACGGGNTTASFGPKKVDIPVPDAGGPEAGPKREREAPPPSGATRESPFPAVQRAQLANGLELATVTSHALPLVQVRVLVRAGSGFGAVPGAAELTGQLLKDGGTRAMTSGELLRRIETLGADLNVHTTFDATVLTMAVPSGELGEALALISQVVREPRFDTTELRKLKTRETDEAQDNARSSGTWTATRVVFRNVFPDKHPYATFGLVPSEIANVDGSTIREFHRRFYVPKATTLVLAGDVEAAAAKELATRYFGSWTGGEPPPVAFPPPRPRDKTRVIVAHRPKSVQSDIYVAMLAPPRNSAIWPAVRVANQVLGGGVASRLFTDVREQRSLAYRTSSQLFELAHGDLPLVAYAGTQTPKTTQAVRGILENLTRMTSAPPTAAETQTARRYLSDLFAIRMETIGSIADMVVTQDTFGLPDGYWDAYRRELIATEPPQVAEASRGIFTPHRALIVVAGDADIIASELASFGAVTVVDPEAEFRPIRTIEEPR